MNNFAKQIMETEDEYYDLDYEGLNIILHDITQTRDSDDPRSYERIKEILKQIEKPPVPISGVAVGKTLFRCRPHKEGEDFFRSINEISYIQNPDNIKDFGRGHEPGQSMFYCSDDAEVAFVETSIVLRNKTPLKQEIVTIGKWIVQKDFTLVNLIVSEYKNKAHETNPVLKQFLTNFLLIRQNMPIDETWIKFMSFFAEEFMDETLSIKKYKTTAAFANYVYDFVGTHSATNEQINVHGILFPSSKYPNKGMNLVLKPEVIDQKWLKLVDVKRFTFTQIDDKKYEETECVSCKSINYDTGLIEWNDFPD